MFVLYVHNIFSDNRRVKILIFLSRKARNLFQNLTLGYMTKTLNQIIFFPPPKSEYFFQQHQESEYLFRKKPYPPFKLNGRSLTMTSFYFRNSAMSQYICMKYQLRNGSPYGPWPVFLYVRTYANIRKLVKDQIRATVPQLMKYMKAYIVRTKFYLPQICNIQNQILDYICSQVKNGPNFHL